jgi:hypothetical protein
MEFGAALRARYPDASRCACEVDGRACTPEHIAIRTMNFGQHWRTAGIEEVAYRVELPRAYVDDVLREHVPGYVEDCRDHPDPYSDELDHAIREAGYPDVAGVLANAALRDPFIEIFRYDILSGWFGAGPPDREPGCVLNTLDRIEVGDDRVAFAGTARRSGVPVRYQDA